MEIKDLKLIPPSKRATAFLRNFMKEHDKGLKAIKTLAEIKEIAQYDVYTSRTDLCLKLNWIKKKISEVIKDEE